MNKNNIAKTLKESEPFAVDVSTGVEKKNGQKDLGLISKFINCVRKKEFLL